MKHASFESTYRHDFEVVEQRQGKVSLYPHTDQLPLLLRALNLEFYGALPGRITRVDHRADGFHKMALHTAALMFCSSVNSSRSDRLRLFSLPNPDLVTKVAIVQQITEETRRGLRHHFRFFTSDGFFPEIHLSGKRLVFADHVLQRFSTRVPNNIGEDLTLFLLAAFGSPMIALPCGPGRAFIIAYDRSLIALPYHETDKEFFITTCLTINEMNSLEPELPPQALNLHYGAAFTEPEARNWIPTRWMVDLFRRWQGKTSLPPPKPHLEKKKWYWVGSCIRDLLIKQGHGPGSRLCFLDNIPGPCVLKLLPGQEELRYNELETYKKVHPEYDWDAIMAERAAQKRASATPPSR